MDDGPGGREETMRSRRQRLPGLQGGSVYRCLGSKSCGQAPPWVGGLGARERWFLGCAWWTDECMLKCQFSMATFEGVWEMMGRVLKKMLLKRCGDKCVNYSYKTVP